MSRIALLLIPLAFMVAALVIGRWWVVVAAAATWAGLAVFLYVNDGWYGHGWGDFGIALNVIAAVATIVGSAGVVAARSYGEKRSRDVTSVWHHGRAAERSDS